MRSLIASLSSCLAELFLCVQLKGDGLEPLRGSDRHTAARRTWQLEMEMVGQWTAAIVIMKPPMKGMNCNKQDISKAVESYWDLFQSFALRRPTMNDPDYWLCALYRCLPCQPHISSLCFLRETYFVACFCIEHGGLDSCYYQNISVGSSLPAGEDSLYSWPCCSDVTLLPFTHLPWITLFS